MTPSIHWVDVLRRSVILRITRGCCVSACLGITVVVYHRPDAGLDQERVGAATGVKYSGTDAT